MKVLLHICCAVCATSCVERLRHQGHQVLGYFYNPNVQPPGEYLIRLQQAEELARRQGFPLLVGDYDVELWFKQARELKDQPEGGRRCARCFRLRLEKAAERAREESCEAFATTLTVSPHKNSQVINEIGRDIANGLFLVRDFKKQDGFKRAQALAKQFKLYHQDYCGCIYSLNQRRDHAGLY